MTIAQKLIDLNNIKQDIKTAIEAKGGVVSNAFSSYATAINNLPSPPSSGGIVYGKSDIVTITPYDATVKTIGDRDFQSWTHATGLVIGEGFETINEYAFYQWTAATSLTLPASLKTIHSNAFNGWSLATSLIIPSGMTTIGMSAFSGWRALAGTLSIPSSVTTLNTNAFVNCRSLEHVIIGSGVSIVQDNTFTQALALKTIDLSANITNLASNAFTQLTQLTQITCRATTPPVITTTSFSGASTSTCIVKVPAASIAAYQAATGWGAFANIVAI